MVKKTITKEYLQDFNDISLAVMFMDDGYKIGKKNFWNSN